MTRYLVRRPTDPPLLGLDSFADDALARRWFLSPRSYAVARFERLRAGFSLNYAAVRLATGVTDHLAGLELGLRLPSRRG
ncbi:hypothetical protein ACFORH_11115 [Amycolatopsis roodepoortensis]|uniref:Uncharacterized protein n=1 Tax=Amycolatopsis roodepoortensis TaxID=700274 RepID=A0ABR9LAM6_9PSEU|nr:hypothetical protein [Amycolatopsis roodepoortensis]MBE1577734.1 hypothetical protein [Amycolatopsis roodepoortensis]